jgi:hypothetical protein
MRLALLHRHLFLSTKLFDTAAKYTRDLFYSRTFGTNTTGRMHGTLVMMGRMRVIAEGLPRSHYHVVV